MARVIEQVDPRSAPAMALLREAALEARALYPELFAPDSPMPGNPAPGPRSVYLVAYDAHMAVGCAALRPLNERSAEVQRVYVTKAARRNGLARALMAQLEVEALVLGYTTLMLETGRRQQPAMALYASLGYARIPAFGAYVGDETSVCFAKTINQNAPAETSRWRRWSGGRRRSSTARRRRRAR